METQDKLLNKFIECSEINKSFTLSFDNIYESLKRYNIEITDFELHLKNDEYELVILSNNLIFSIRYFLNKESDIEESILLIKEKEVSTNILYVAYCNTLSNNLYEIKCFNEQYKTNSRRVN